MLLSVFTETYMSALRRENPGVSHKPEQRAFPDYEIDRQHKLPLFRSGLIVLAGLIALVSL
ncbi:hypothetical protein ABIE63_003544 [Limibacillus sp. MBR-115]|jgi:hypothetical protein